MSFSSSIKLRRPSSTAVFSITIFIVLAVIQYQNTTQLQHHVGSLIYAALVILLSSFFLFVLPIPQQKAYHNFADKRRCQCECGIPKFLPANVSTRNVRGVGFIVPNFGDVASNVVILIGGICGLVSLILLEYPNDTTTNHPSDHDDWQTKACLPIFFGSYVAISMGSTYYHWKPNNATLVWDRLPMTVAFAAIFCFMLDEYLPSHQSQNVDGIGRVLLTPLIAVGVMSVLYWSWVDDLRLYVAVSILPMFIMLLLVIFYEPKHTGKMQQLLGLALYAGAKICEDRDYEIFYFTGNRLSGHSLKHILAGLAPVVIAQMVYVRD